MEQYFIITAKMYWGRGETLLEAAKNAHVGAKYVEAAIYKRNPDVVEGDLQCSGMGSCTWTYSDEYLDSIKDLPEKEFWQARDQAGEDMKIFHGDIHVTKGQVEGKQILKG